MRKWILLILMTIFAQWAHADSGWEPQGKDRWHMRIEGVGGEADIYVRLTTKKKVLYRVVLPCPDMEPVRKSTLTWKAGDKLGNGVTCYGKKVLHPSPPLWEEFGGAPMKAQRYLKVPK